MAKFIENNKPKENMKKKGKPCGSGLAPPPNRFEIWPGYHRMEFVSKKVVEELASKRSVEDM
eukprot:bmy_13168T0